MTPRAGSAPRPTRDPVKGGQESVWDYPRPPRLEASARPVRVTFQGRVIAQSSRSLRVLETSLPPSYYVPPEDVDRALLNDVTGSTVCEWKGRATYSDIVIDGNVAPRAAWRYRKPAAPFAALRDHYAFYPSRVACELDGEHVKSQDGDFYGGWITSHVAGPFKGAATTLGW